jgi:uncharacterized protein YjiS (DUF1127 family)
MAPVHCAARQKELKQLSARADIIAKHTGTMWVARSGSSGARPGHGVREMARTKDVLDDLAEWYSLPAGSAAKVDGASARRWFVAQPEVDLRSAVRRGLIKIAEAFLAWHDRARERRALIELSDHMLRDIGISRAEACREAARPFWRS